MKKNGSNIFKKTKLLFLAVMVFLTGCTNAPWKSSSQTNDFIQEDRITQEDSSKVTVQNKQKDKTQENKIRIGVTLAGSDASYQVMLANYIQAQCKKDDVELTLSYAQWDAKAQTATMTEFIQEEMDAIILCPVNVKSMLSSLKEAAAAKIPVINLNMKVDAISTEYISTYVGASMIEEAVLAAQLVEDIINNQEGNVAIIEGTPGTDPQIYRTEGFFNAISSLPQIKVVQIGEGDWDRDKSYRQTLTIIQKNPNISIIYAQDSEMAMGAVRAVEEKNLVKQIQVIGIGEGNEYLQAVKDGKLYGLIYQDAQYEATQAVKCAIEAASGNTLRPWYKNPVQIVTKENVETIESSLHTQ